MTTLRLTGLDGANPLEFLASLGALLLSDDACCGNVRLAWSADGGGFRPRLELDGEDNAVGWCEAITGKLRQAGAEATPEAELKPLKRALADLKAAQNKRLGRLKAARAARRKAKADNEEEARTRLTAVEQELRDGKRDIERSERSLATALGYGVAHLGDIIGVAPDIYQTHVAHALEPGADPALARQLAALASDGCTDKRGQLSPTPLSFGNGASGKCLLKDFRALARRCSADKLRASLLDAAPVLEDATSLNWSPSDLRSYAHRWHDPATHKTGVDAVVNALAYFGLGLLPVAPRASGPEAVAFPGRKGLVWPVWQYPLEVPVVGSLLAESSSWVRQSDHRPRAAPAARGILAIFFSARVNPSGKRNFLAPAQPL